jgi:hemolysin III
MDWLHVREPVSAWTHGAWGLCCVPATLLLQWRAGRHALKQIGFAVFGLSLALCFAGSWLYHSVPPPSVPLCMRLDYIGIYLLIAGTYTPVVLVVLDGWRRWSMLSSIWLMGVIGIALRACAVELPDEVSTGLYILMGWVSLLCYVELARRLSHSALCLLWVGGLIYSGSAVLNVLHWPSLWPGVFGSHELYHLFVIAASLCHFLFMARVVAPYQSLSQMECCPSPFKVRRSRGMVEPVNDDGEWAAMSQPETA